MTDTSTDSACRLTEDALHLAVSLDSFTTLDLAERIGPAVQRGRRRLADLQRRRVLLTLARADGAIIGWVLETISARLNFLERLNTGLCRSSQGEIEQEGQVPCDSSDHSDASSSNRENQCGTVREPRRGLLKFPLGGGHAA